VSFACPEPLGLLTAAEAEGLLLPDVECAEIRHGGIYIDSEGRVTIGGFRDEWLGRSCPALKIGEEHNLYEWAMALADRHPYGPAWCPGVEDEARQDIRVDVLRLREESSAVFDAIFAAYKAGEIKPCPVAWYKKQPGDPTLLRFRRGDILTAMGDLGADGEAIRLLMAAGGARQSVKHEGRAEREKPGDQAVEHEGSGGDEPPAGEADDPGLMRAIAWMRANFRKGTKRDDAIRDCMTGTKCTWRVALAAYGTLPDDVKRGRGKRDVPNKGN
jgi:hypothetical protein